MLKYSANYILNANGKLVTNHTLVTSDSGEILDLVQGVSDDIKVSEGILMPGFINTHCHLELSNLKNKIREGTQLHGFIHDILKIRNVGSESILPEIQKADTEMWENGIQGVGDISNTEFSFATKSKSKIRYHTFIELLNLNRSTTAQTFDSGIELLGKLNETGEAGSIVPHASYSVPRELFQFIKNHHDHFPGTWSIHNQETYSEDELFISGTGEIKMLFESMQIVQNPVIPTGKNSLRYVSNFFPKTSRILFVHNTFTVKTDIDFLKSCGNFNKTYFAICINANLYIENKIPDLNMLQTSGCKITIGTDSLASNYSLSVLDEIKTIHLKYPAIPVEDLLNWSTANGAACLGWSDLGSFEKNKTPGIILLTNASPQGIEKSSKVIRMQ